MSKWLNNKKVFYKDIIKPCRSCGYCPYGQLVEEFPLNNPSKYRSCEIFGHDCPVYYLAELFAMEKKITTEEKTKQDLEFEKIIKGDFIPIEIVKRK